MRVLLDKVFARVSDPAQKCFSKIANLWRYADNRTGRQVFAKFRKDVIFASPGVRLHGLCGWASSFRFDLTAVAKSGLCRGFKLIHHEKTSRNLPPGGLRLAALLPVSDRRMAHGLVEETAKRSETLKANFEANICDP